MMAKIMIPPANCRGESKGGSGDFCSKRIDGLCHPFLLEGTGGVEADVGCGGDETPAVLVGGLI